MIIFLYGQDTYRLKEKLQEIIERYQQIHKSGLNLRYFTNEHLNFQDFQDEFQQASMFEEKKLVVLKNVFANPEFQKSFKKGAKKFINSEDIIVISETGKISSKDSLFKWLKQKATFQEFELLEGAKLEAWIKEEFQKQRAKIAPQALKTLIDFVGNDLWRLSNEIKKLVNYKRKDKILKISKKDVELLVKPKIEPNIFKTIDFIASSKKKKALELLKGHLEKGDSPLYLLSMINFQFRNLLIIRDFIEKGKPYYLISKETSLHPYTIKKSYALAKRFSMSELKKIYQKIFQVDLDIKTGKITPEVALDLLIAQI